MLNLYFWTLLSFDVNYTRSYIIVLVRIYVKIFVSFINAKFQFNGLKCNEVYNSFSGLFCVKTYPPFGCPIFCTTRLYFAFRTRCFILPLCLCECLFCLRSARWITPNLCFILRLCICVSALFCLRSARWIKPRHALFCGCVIVRVLILPLVRQMDHQSSQYSLSAMIGSARLGASKLEGSRLLGVSKRPASQNRQ